MYSRQISLKKIIIFLTIATTVSFSACAKEKKSKDVTAQAAEQNTAIETQQRNPIVQIQNPSKITVAAVKSGVQSCAPRIDQVSKFLTSQSESTNALVFLPPNNPNQSLVSVSMEVPLPGMATSAYASESFAPNQANGCGGMYETVTYWKNRCADVASKSFGNLKRINAFSKTIIALDGGISTKIFLMPADNNGCISIKKEVVQ
ncbi:hypothetical protein [Desulfobulbus sp.]|uniref:hypothetical protein n=1 Tax=Desulfobulbus sp. TaxID=895 RepID=UPI0027BA6A57|nr:hypothetical protein [Desulfobulbus sp.]